MFGLPSLLVLLTPIFEAEAAGQPSATQRAGEVVIGASFVTTPDGSRVSYEAGTLFVPENRLVANSRIIGVGFARIRAKPATGAPPIFILPGGPGRSYMGALTGSDPASKRLLAELLRYTAAGDIVIVDQRGWSARGDALELAAADKPLGEPRNSEAETADMIALAHRAVDAYPGKDLGGYTIVQCAEDVNDLRVALHYPKISLSGQSFGSQWSFAVMRLHPGVVARAVLSGTEPLDKSFDMPSHIFAALQRVAWEAEQDPKVKPYLPKAGLVGAIRTVEARLRAAPATVALPGSPSAPPRRIRLGVGDFQASLLRAPANWPAFVLSAYHGHYEELAVEAAQRRANGEGPVRLIEPLIDSSLGAPPGLAYLLATDPAADMLGTWDFAALMGSADAWPTPQLDDIFLKPVMNSTPVVFIHGDWDIATPVENMLGVLPYFPNARALLVHRGRHHTREPLFDERPDIAAQIMRFLRTGEIDGMPAEATLRAPQFDVPVFPPPN